MRNYLFDDFGYDTGAPDGTDWEPVDFSDWDDYPDWKEESGWNDVYGSDVEASDIIDFGD